MLTVPTVRGTPRETVGKSYRQMAALLLRAEQLRDGPQLADVLKDALEPKPEPKLTKAVTERKPSTDLPALMSAMRAVLSEDKPPVPSKPTDRGPLSPLGGLAR
jgi:hypothetical protein